MRFNARELLAAFSMVILALALSILAVYVINFLKGNLRFYDIFYSLLGMNYPYERAVAMARSIVFWSWIGCIVFISAIVVVYVLAIRWIRKSLTQMK